jgi:excisionase family DNA binding protein
MAGKLSTGQAARRLGVSPQYVRTLIARGTLASEDTPLGALLLESEVERLAQTRRVMTRRAGTLAGGPHRIMA